VPEQDAGQETQTAGCGRHDQAVAEPRLGRTGSHGDRSSNTAIAVARWLLASGFGAVLSVSIEGRGRAARVRRRAHDPSGGGFNDKEEPT